VCAQCSTAPAAPAASGGDPRAKEMLRQLLSTTRGSRDYDALCCYSGGKDSSYILKMLVQDHGLRVLALTLDNGFIVDEAKRNIREVVSRLGIDHIYFTPAWPVLKKIIRSVATEDIMPSKNHIKRSSDICFFCIYMINSISTNIAIEKKIPMIFSGFMPGQTPRAIIRNGYKYLEETFASMESYLHTQFGPEALKYFRVTAPATEEVIYNIAPYLIEEKSEAEILEAITPLGWVRPVGLDGCSSNCSLNSLGVFLHEKKYGFHPYALELSQLVRRGLLPRDKAIEKLKNIADENTLRQVLAKLDMPADTFADHS
jgi:hypothetical protein